MIVTILTFYAGGILPALIAAHDWLRTDHLWTGSRADWLCLCLTSLFWPALVYEYVRAELRDETEDRP